VKNITITLDEKTAAWVRVHAAERGKSLSRFVGEMLQDRMRELRDYDQAMRRYFAMKPLRFRWADGRKPGRDELHDRADLR
jgi:hypothetical protein